MLTESQSFDVFLFAEELAIERVKLYHVRPPTGTWHEFKTFINMARGDYASFIVDGGDELHAIVTHIPPALRRRCEASRVRSHLLAALLIMFSGRCPVEVSESWAARVAGGEGSKARRLPGRRRVVPFAGKG